MKLLAYGMAAAALFHLMQHLNTVPCSGQVARLLAVVKKPDDATFDIMHELPREFHRVSYDRLKPSCRTFCMAVALYSMSVPLFKVTPPSRRMRMEAGCVRHR